MRAKNTCSHGPTFVRKVGRRLFTSLQIALPNFSGRQPLFSDNSTFCMAFAKLSSYCGWERVVWLTCRYAVKPVWKSPGSPTQTCIPSGFTSWQRSSLYPSITPFDTLYEARKVLARDPSLER